VTHEGPIPVTNEGPVPVTNEGPVPVTNEGPDSESSDAWGFADTSFSVDPAGVVRLSGSRYELCGFDLPSFLPFAREVLGAAIDPGDVRLPRAPSPLPASRVSDEFVSRLGATFSPDQIALDDAVRRRHGRGQTQEEIFAIRHGTLGRMPDAVVYPSSEGQVIALVDAARAFDVCLIPFGGGTNVTEALRCPEDDPRPIVSVDMRRMNRILSIDVDNRMAHVEAGAVGRDLAAALAARGFTIGHEPDSVEFSTLGGWIATRASGMKKNRYGNIEDIVLDVRMVTPEGTLARRTPSARESVGPDTRSLVFGSEGNLGIVTSAVVKLFRLPDEQRYGCVLFRDFATGVRFLRDLSSAAVMPASVRLVDNLQFRFGLALKPRATAPFARWKSGVEKWFITNAKGFRGDALVACTLVFEGTKAEVRAQRRAVAAVAARHGGVQAGSENGRRGYQLTFGIAYIRDFVMKHHVLAESFETSVAWSRIEAVCSNVRRRVEDEHRARALPGKPFLSCRVTQLYDTGVCIYFYLAYYFKGVADPAGTFAEIERAAREEILAAGGSLSHHHGVGKIRQRFLPEVQPPLAASLVTAAKQALDPTNVFGARNNALGSDSGRVDGACGIRGSAVEYPAEAVSHPVFHTFAEYVRLEEESTVRHEFVGGRIYAMAGGTPEHSALKVAMILSLGRAVEGGRCRVYDSDLRIRVRKTGLCTYPDASVVCGPREVDPEDKNTVTNPTLLVEVTSGSTEEYDRSEKFEHCRDIASLGEYVLVSHRERSIEVRRREAGGVWTVTLSRAGERAELRTIDCTIEVDALYDAVLEPRV
jgi:alkyldihydroxyacetonephosphate synthase